KPHTRGMLDRWGAPASGWESVVNGYVVRVNWSALQTTAGGPIVAGNPIDKAVAAVRAYNATVRAGQPHEFLKIRLYAGIGAPTWAKTLDGPAVAIHDAADPIPPDDTPETIGRFWTPNFAAAYQ